MCAFGTFQDWHQRVPVDRYIEASPRLDIWQLLQCGALVEGTATELAFEGTGGAIGDPMGGPRLGRTVNVCREGPNVAIDGINIALAWDTPMEGVERPWFRCDCGRRCRFLYLRDAIRCARCHWLQNASRHLRRQTPGVGRVERLRRKLGDCEPKPFAPLPARIRRGRSRAYHDKLVAMIHDEETALLEHLGSVVRDLSRRIRVRKERGQW